MLWLPRRLTPSQKGESMAGAWSQRDGCSANLNDNRSVRMTTLDLRTTADPTVAGPTEPGTVGSGDTDGAGTAPQILADGAPADGEWF